MANDKIEIDGLNKKQIGMLNKIWSFKTQKEFNDWRDTLESEEDVTTVNSLLRCLLDDIAERNWLKSSNKSLEDGGIDIMNKLNKKRN